MADFEAVSRLRKTYVRGFHVDYYQVCPFCFSKTETQDHHCKGSDKIVDALRNRLDDMSEAEGGQPRTYCDHDDILKRRTPYVKQRNQSRKK